MRRQPAGVLGAWGVITLKARQKTFLFLPDCKAAASQLVLPGLLCTWESPGADGIGLAGPEIERVSQVPVLAAAGPGTYCHRPGTSLSPFVVIAQVLEPLQRVRILKALLAV